MENNIVKEVIVEFEGTSTCRKMIRFDNDVDFENPSEELKELLFNKFLRSQPFDKEKMRILHDENLNHYAYEEPYSDGKSRPVGDELVYMDEEYFFEDQSTKKVPNLGELSCLKGLGIKSSLSYIRICPDNHFSSYFREGEVCDSVWFIKEKEEIHELWKKKKFQSLVALTNYSHMHNKEVEKRFKMYHRNFEKDITTKKEEDSGGIFLLVLNDLEDVRKRNGTPENSIILGKKLVDV